MKKIFIATLFCLILAFSSGCGSHVPNGMSDETYNVGVKALEIMDKYNNADITADEADERLDSLYDKLKSLDFEESSDEYVQNSLVSSSIYYFQFLIGPFKDSNFATDDPYSQADDLRELLGLD